MPEDEDAPAENCTQIFMTITAAGVVGRGTATDDRVYEGETE